MWSRKKSVVLRGDDDDDLDEVEDEDDKVDDEKTTDQEKLNNEEDKEGTAIVQRIQTFENLNASRKLFIELFQTALNKQAEIEQEVLYLQDMLNSNKSWMHFDQLKEYYDNWWASMVDATNVQIQRIFKESRPDIKLHKDLVVTDPNVKSYLKVVIQGLASCSQDKEEYIWVLAYQLHKKHGQENELGFINLKTLCPWFPSSTNDEGPRVVNFLIKQKRIVKEVCEAGPFII